MFENRSLPFDLAALALLAVTTFLTASVLSYKPADPVAELPTPFSYLYSSDTLVYPPNDTVQNLCGPWGAFSADVILSGLGVGAYYLLASLFSLSYLLLRRIDITTPKLRMTGWLASLFGFVTLIAMILPGFSPGPVIGSGGYLGAFGRSVLEAHFAYGGGIILALGLTAAGLFLATDYAMLRLASVLGLFGITMGAAVARRAKMPQGWRASSEQGEEISGPHVKLSGRRGKDDLSVGLVTTPIIEKQLEEDDEEYEEEEEEIEEKPLVVRPSKKKPAKTEEVEEEAPKKNITAGPHFKIKKPKPKTEREMVIEQLNQVAIDADHADYELPTTSLLTEGEEIDFEEQEKEVLRKAHVLEETFKQFGFNVKVVEIETGPVIAQYEIALEAGLRLSKITGLAEDIAIALRVPSVRIVAPIPGKNTVGIEVPNENRQTVRLREVMEESASKIAKMKIPLFLGKDVSGNSMVADLAALPHLLIAGRTGTGKSVALNAIISSILMTRRPDEVRMLMIDPKMVELSGYGRLPHLMHPVVTDMKKAEAILAWAVEKMEERYSLLARAGVRHITSYNQLGEEELMDRLQPEDEEAVNNIPTHMPFIVIVADEMADLMMTAGKEVEQHIIRLAQKSRAVGIHLILATQKPTVDVITGLIKSNLPARISFQVASRTDSRVVLDENGADKLLGNGDMLFLWPGTSTLLRGQGTFLSDDEINSVTDVCSRGEQVFVKELVNLKVDKDDEEGEAPSALKKRDELYEGAVDVVVREGRGSVSLLQRSLGIGYGRAARLIDFMAEDGIVGEYAGSQAREVLISMSDWETMQGLEPSEDVEDEEAEDEVEDLFAEDEEEEFEEEFEDKFETA